MRLDEQLKPIRELKNGWFDGKGTAYLGEDLNWLNINYPGNSPIPIIFPMVCGGIEFDYCNYSDLYNITLEIDFIKKTGFLHNCFLQANYDFECITLNLNNKIHWQFLESYLNERL
jgi:hypothetical protein